jgi:hypothetical protein
VPITIVVLPEHVARHWRERLLYNQTAKRLKAALIDRELLSARRPVSPRWPVEPERTAHGER